MTPETRCAALRRGWYPVARTLDLDRPRQAMLLGRRLVVFRTLDGYPRVLPDRCLHRGGALHRGAVIGDSIECPHHGWRWRGADGQCVYIPSHGPPTPIPQASVIEAFPAVERYGLVWTCVGDPLTGPPHLQSWNPSASIAPPAFRSTSKLGSLTAMENSGPSEGREPSRRV
jgi:phenylpropionate dioxygenase-like ring-hydroxylating dioxygenase large terminal subunit